jgi:molybdopterin-guanine dinucleotide biosynthesis protein A
VSVADEEQRRALRRTVSSPVEWRIDRDDVWGPGPGGAIARSLADSGPGSVLFLPGDLPWIETEALRRFVDAASSSGVEVAAPAWGSGETEHLVQWHVGTGNSRLAAGALRDDDGSMRASVFLRAAARTLLVPVGSLTNRPRVFLHLTRPGDLLRPTPRGGAGSRADPWRVVGAPKDAYASATRHNAEGNFAAAAGAFSSEARWYRAAGLPLLARHAENDAEATVNRASGLRRPA